MILKLHILHYLLLFLQVKLLLLLMLHSKKHNIFLLL